MSDSAAAVEDEFTLWLRDNWREVAKEYCRHREVGRSCRECRLVVSEVADIVDERWRDR